MDIVERINKLKEEKKCSNIGSQLSTKGDTENS